MFNKQNMNLKEEFQERKVSIISNTDPEVLLVNILEAKWHSAC